GSPVTNRNHGPRRDRFPGWRPGGFGEGGGGGRTLGGGHDSGSVLGQVGGKGIMELCRVDDELWRCLPVLPGRIQALDERRIEDAVLRVRLDAAKGFTILWREGGHEHQPKDIL